MSEPEQGSLALEPAAAFLPPFPRFAADLDVEWLNRALCQGGVMQRPWIDSIDVEVIGVGEGFMGQVARIRTHCESDEAKAPPTLIAKFASPNEQTRQLAKAQNYYGREIGFYREIARDVGVPVPRCYYSDLDPDRHFFVLLLEDLHPAEPSDQVVGTDEEGSRQVVEALAELHARWWNSERLAGYDWAKPFTDERPLEDGLAMLKASIARVETEGSFDRYPEMKVLLHRLPPLFRVQPPPPFPFTLAHGDMRSDNVLFPSKDGGRFAFVDWQLCGRDLGARDLARWLVQSISIEQRRATEQDLLAYYHELLRKNGVTDYSLRKLKTDYQLSIVVMYLMFSMGLYGVDTSPDRSEALFHAMHERLDAALVDWKIGRLLKALPLMLPVMKITTWLQMKFSRDARPS